MLDDQKGIQGKVIVFHRVAQRYQQAFRLQQAHEAIITLTTAITRLPKHFPEQVTTALPEGSLLLSPPVIFIAQQLVNVIRHVIDCHLINLKAIVQPSGRCFYIAGSGFQVTQEVSERLISGLLTLSDMLDKKTVASLYNNIEVTIRGDQLSLPLDCGAFISERILIIPLFVEEQLSGLICITKPGINTAFTSEEITLVKAVASQAMLIVECLSRLQGLAQTQIRNNVLQEVQRLSNNFLILASHELRTPLTGILGNLQLAQRRLEILNQQIVPQADQVSERIAQAQQPLASASQSAQIQQRMINDIVDDARIQSNQLTLHLQLCDLLALLKAAIEKQHTLRPEHTIILETPPEAQNTSTLADIERVTQVIDTYLTNALTYSPPQEPVTAQLAIENETMRISIHNAGPDIPREEQEHIWERFYRSKGSGVQHELDLSLGLGLYLCQALIRYQGGNVGLQSAPAQGATFWFTLPITSHAPV
jgi:signal transduction histidine kinase